MAINIKKMAAKKVLSIAINNEYLKICEMTKGSKSTVIHKVATIATPERSYSDGMIRDRGLLAKTIKVALDENRMTASNVIFSVASTKIATKEVIIPNIKASKIGEVINTNATDYFPVNINEYIIQYSVLERLPEDDTKLKVLVIAAPSDIIEPYYDLASSLQVTIDAIDYMGNSTYQALRLQIDASPSIVIQVENDSTIINIFNNNVLQLQRTIPYGKSVVVNAVMDTFSMKYDPALSKLQKESLLHPSFDGDAVTDSLRYLINNVNRIIDYYVSRNANKPLENAYIIGNATTINGLVALFANELRLPLVCIDSLKDVICDKKTYVEETSLPSYITNIGALIAPVNFIPKSISSEEKAKDDNKLIRLMLIASFAVSVGLIAYSLVMMIIAMTVRDTQQAEVRTLRSQGVEDIVNGYYDAKDILSDVEKFRELTVNDDDELTWFINTLEDIMPSDVSIKSMNVANGVVTLSCAASSRDSAGKLIDQIRNTNGILLPWVGSITGTKDANEQVAVTFSFTCTFSGLVKDVMDAVDEMIVQ